MLTAEEAASLLSLLQQGYQVRKASHQLYGKDDKTPQAIIEIYLNYVLKPKFDIIYEDYKSEYIYNESKVESTETLEERKGLGAVYDYIQGFDVDHDYFNVFATSLLIHNKLYSYCAPGFGGQLRESEVILYDSNVEIPPASEARKAFNQLIPLADYPFSFLENGDVFHYINQCIILTTDLIRLQPFADGNKRTFRSLLNLLLKKIEIPPIYIEEKERKEYKKALMIALEKKDYTSIIQFYYYKICDAIMKLNPEESILSSGGKALEKVYYTKNSYLGKNT